MFPPHRRRSGRAASRDSEYHPPDCSLQFAASSRRVSPMTRDRKTSLFVFERLTRVSPEIKTVYQLCARFTFSPARINVRPFVLRLSAQQLHCSETPTPDYCRAWEKEREGAGLETRVMNVRKFSEPPRLCSPASSQVSPLRCTAGRARWEAAGAGPPP